MCALGSLYTSFAPAGAPALAELGHPDVASGRYSCAARSYGATTSPVSMSPLGGALTSHTKSPQCPQLNVHSWRAVCGTSPEYSPSRLRAHPSQAEQPAARSRRTPHPLLHLPEKGIELVGERPVCSVATSGCPKRSEDGFPVGARNIPPRPAQPNSKQKASYREVGGVRRAADGNRTRVSGLGSVRSTIELQPHLFQCIAPACLG